MSSTPGFNTGDQPSATQWNSYFGAKSDVSYANYAAVRANTTPQTDLFVLGCVNANDGGEGPFAFVPTDTTSADNGGTILVDANGRRFYRMYTGPVVTSWFGAKGDGGTDATAAIQAAVNEGLRIGAGVWVPVGQYYLSNTIIFDPNGFSRGFKFEGAFLGRDDKGVSFRLHGTGFAAIFQLNATGTDNFNQWQFKNFRLETFNSRGATAGLLFNGTNFSYNFVEKVAVGFADGGGGLGPVNGFQIIAGDGANGEFTHFLDCEFEAVDCGFTSNAGQAYVQRFDHCNGNVNVGGTYFNVPTGGGGIVVTDFNGTSSQTPVPPSGSSPTANATLLRTNDQSSVCKFIGGRVEHVTCMAVIGAGGGIVSFDGMDITWDLDPTNADCTTLYAVDGGSNGSVMVHFSNMQFGGGQNNTRSNTFPIKAFGGFNNAWHVVFDNCTWGGGFARPPYGVMMSPNFGFNLRFIDCLVQPPTNGQFIRFEKDYRAGEFTPGGRSIDGDSAWMMAGTPDQQLLNPQIANSNGGAVTPASGWIASAPGTISIYDYNGPSAGGLKALNASPFARRITFANQQSLSQTLTNIDLSSSTWARYLYNGEQVSLLTWHIFIRTIGDTIANQTNSGLTFTIKDSVSGAIIDSADYHAYPDDTNGKLITVSAPWPKQPAVSHPVVTMQSNLIGQVYIEIEWQLFSTLLKPAFAPVTAPLTYTNDTSATADSVSIWNRFIPPYKSDTFGSTAPVPYPNLVTDTYRSSDTGWLTAYSKFASGGAGAWTQTPTSFYASGAPVSGTWNKLDQVFNTAPASGSVMGWLCIASGSPGTWRPFGQVN